MRTSNLLKSAVATIISLTVIITTTTHAQGTKPAQTGVILAGGSKTSGGTVNYGFVLTASEAGSLSVKASIKFGKSKVNFPDLNSTPDAGVSAINGPTVNIPDGFLGSATMKVKVKFNGKSITKRSIAVAITASPPVVDTVSTNLLDVGFENTVALDSSIVPTTGMGGSLTYAWTQTGGKPATLSADDVATPTFVTDAITNFVNMGTSLYVNDIDDNGYTNAAYVIPSCRFGPVGSIPLDAEQAGAATYGFRVLVSDGSITRTGIFTVACSIQTPAQPNVPVGVYAHYKAATNSTSWSFISAPAGSTAALIHTNGLIPELRPDVEGVYILQDNVSGQVITNTAATWTGYQFCAICHGPGNNVGNQDLVTPWSKTGHASFFQRAVDGETSAGSHYNESCITCHVVGNNKAPAAVNGGFDDVAKELGWTFPAVLKPGNFAAMPSQLQNLANIQCESCHGPGSRHPGAPSVSLDVKVCASCHQDGSHHNRPAQWEISPHSGAYENIAASRGTNPQCARCHSPAGYTEVADGDANVSTTNSVPTGTGPLTCQTCHDPHDNFDTPGRHQLRVYDTALLGNPYFRSNDVTIALGEQITTADPRLTNSNLNVTGLGNMATCITCHNGRQLPTQVQTYGTTKGQMFYQVGGPHDQTAGEAFLGNGMYDYGQMMGNSFHTYLASCQACHMYQLKAGDTILTNDMQILITADNLANYANLVGDHTYEMDHVSVDGGVTNVVDNIAACNQCHASFEPVESFDFKSSTSRDYDGNGVIEGVQTETKGVLANLAYLIMYGNGGTNGIWATTNTTAEVVVPLTLVTNKVAGVTNSVVIATGSSRVSSFQTAVGYYSTNAVVADAQRKAVWNWLAAYREGSFGVHNTQYIIRLLQTTYTDLSTNYYGDASKTYLNAYPNAFLR